MKQFLRHIFLLVALFVAVANVWAQTYNGGTWYSLYDAGEMTLHTIASKEYSVFAPTNGSITFNWYYDGVWGSRSHDTKIYESNNDGGDYSHKGTVSGRNTDWPSASVGVSKNINKLKFARETGNTWEAKYKNIKLPLAKHILLESGTYGTASTSVSFGNVTIDGTSTAQTVKLRSFLTNGDITIKSNNNAFRIKTSTNINGDVYAVGANACAVSGGSGNAGGGNLGNIDNYTITIYFCPSEAKEYTGTITLTDGTSTATISVSGTGLKKNQSIVWSDKFAANEPSIPVGKEVSDAATATSGLTPIIYTSSDESIIDITNDGKSFKALAAGTATITATQAGDSKWNSTSSSKPIKVTEKKIQYIKWTDNLTRFKTGDAPFTMTATAHILVNVETEETVEAPDRTALIKYTSANPSIVSVNGKELTIVGAGETTVTATLEGDEETYERAEITMPVRVRNITDGCEAYVLDAPNEVKYSAPFGGSYETNTWTAPTGKLTFEARIGNGSAVGNIEVQQLVNGSWKDIDNFMPPTSWTEYGPYDLDRNATQVRFYSNGSFNRFIKNVLVTQATYVEPFVNGVKLAENETFVLPETAVGVNSQSTFELNWSTCDDEGVFLEVDDPTKFTVQPDFIPAQSVNYNKTPITVTCIDPSVANSTVTGNIIIRYDGNKTYNQPVSCHIKDKLETWFTYQGESTYSSNQTISTIPFTLMDQNGVVLGVDHLITYTSSNPDIVSYGIEDGKSVMYVHCGGQVTIIATFAGDAAHKSTSLTQTITVDKCIPTITWTQSLSNFETNEDGTINEERQLTAVADPAFPITYTLDEDAQQIAEIITEDGVTYIRVFGIGTGRITASTTEVTFSGREYTSASSVKLLRVRKPGDCSPYSLSIDEEQNTHGWGTNYMIYEIKGLPENTMIFGAHVNTGSINNSLYVDFSLDGNSWIERQQFTIGEEYKWDYTCPVPDKARFVRFETTSSLLTFFNMVTIRQQTYLRTDKTSIHIDAIVNQPFSTELTVEYSNKPTIEYAISNTNQLGLKLTPDRDVDNTCDEYGSYTFTLEGTIPYPLTETVTEYITLTNSAGDNITIPVTINATLLDEIYYYTNTDGNWSTLANWRINETLPAEQLPTSANRVVISKPVSIDKDDATAYSIEVQDGGSITVLPTGGLTVHAGGFTGANENNLTLHNMQSGAGYIRISSHFTKEVTGTMPKIKVFYQTKSTLDTGANKDATWQYIGAPGADCQFTVDYITWLYHWSEAQGWINKTGNLTLEPFAGYAITQYGKPTYELVSKVINEDKTITLTKTDTEVGMKGDNLFANSYSAPLDAKNFTEEDFYGDIVKTFYLFNSGSWNDWNNQDNTIGNNSSETPGQYRAIPALAASYIDQKYDHTTIPPMQGVYMIANENGATITLDYDKHVWKAGSAAGTNMHEPMRAPSHNAYQLDNFRRLRVQINSANSGADRMYVIQNTINTPDYDNGYDAPNQLAEGLANIYTNEHFGQMEVSCSNHIDSTFVGFTAGSDSIYTLRFNAIIGDDLHMLDLDNDSIILLEEDATYTFHATPHSKNDLRFQILLHPEKNLDFGEEEKDDIYTDVTDVHTTQVWSHGSYIYINNAPTNTIATLYNISGHKLLTTPIHHTPYTLDLSYLPKGVYMLQLNTNVYKFVIQ